MFVKQNISFKFTIMTLKFMNCEYKMILTTEYSKKRFYSSKNSEQREKIVMQ